MFEKFGEFNSYEEINKYAAGLLAEGDNVSLYELAKENGIDKEMVDIFIAGDIDFICDEESAAVSKIDIEVQELKAKEIMSDWAEYIKGCIAKEPAMAAAVRKKGKNLKECISKLLVWSFKNAQPVDNDILKAAGAPSGCKLGIPGIGTAKKIIREYYLGK